MNAPAAGAIRRRGREEIGHLLTSGLCLSVDGLLGCQGEKNAERGERVDR